MHITSEEAAVINVGIGALLGWGGGALNQWRIGRNTARDARAGRRRDSYADLILAFDHLERAFVAGETLESDHQELNMGQITGGALREINRAYVAVLLSGSEEAKKAAATARNTAWDLNNALRGRDRESRTTSTKFFDLFDKFGIAIRRFVEIAERELG